MHGQSHHHILKRKILLELVFILVTLTGCVALTGTEPALESNAGSGLEGLVVLHGISGGPVTQGVPDYRPLANTIFEVKKGEAIAATFTTDEQGRFRISLPPGHYRISKKDWKSRVGFFGPFEVDIAVGEMKKVEWNCRTGMQ